MSDSRTSLKNRYIRTLRKEGIVDGSAIRVGDAEKVFDALEKSRNRRGITKHRLLSSQDRNLRQEQVKINKAHLKPQLLLAGTSDNREANTPASVGADKEKGSLNRNAAEAGLSLPLESRAKTSRPGFGTLLVARDSYQLSNLCKEEFLVEVVDNVAAADLYQQQQSCMQQGTLLGMDPSTTEDSTGAKGHMEAKSHEVQAPVLGTSYLNKHHSVSTSCLSPNGGTTSNRSSPVRSCFLESAVSDCNKGNPDQNNTSTVPSCSFSQQYSGCPHEGSEGTVAVGGGGSSEGGGTAGSTYTLQPFPGPNNERVKATGINYYAKTTSSSVTADARAETQPKQSPLVVSIPLTALPSTATSSSAASNSCGEPTVHSHCATKKRPSPSVGGNHDTPPVPNELQQVGLPCGSDPTKADGSEEVGKQPIKKSTRNKTGKLPIRSTPVWHCPADEGTVTKARRKPRRGSEIPTKGFAEDNEISVARSTAVTSCSGASVKNRATCVKSSRQSQRGGSRRSSRAAHNSDGDLLMINSSFSFQAFFSHLPPRLTVRDGELVPERSLSIKDFDQFSIPASHPFHTWSLGQPVPGRLAGVTSAPRAKRPRKITRQSSK